MKATNDKNDASIAIFMGATISTKVIAGREFFVADFPKKSGLDYWLEYSNSWSWLMPVLEKIEKEGCIIEMSMSLAGMTRIFNVKHSISFCNESMKLIDSAYNSVIDYINWKNKELI